VSVRVKICGVTRLEDARAAWAAGADALGLNFYPRSPRYVEPAKAAALARTRPALGALVGVFVNESPDVIRARVRHSGIRGRGG
jgi:phosphoribosylanthranilate isomerase